MLFKHKQVLVTYTTSMGTYLQSLYGQFKGQKGISISILSEGADIETLKLHTEYYRDYYSREGFILLQAHLRRTVQYTVRAIPSNDFRSFTVELVTARGDSRVTGLFKSSKEAKEFIETCYGSDNPFRLPVYAWNCDTKQFILEKKMLDIK